MKVRGTLIFGASYSNLAITISTPLLAQPQSGIASVYSNEKTANGEYAHADTTHGGPPHAALRHVGARSPTSSSGRSVIVRINDRGPYIAGRIIDLTPAGAKAIGSNGLAPVTLTVLRPSRPTVGPPQQLSCMHGAGPGAVHKSPCQCRGFTPAIVLQS